MAFNAVWSIDIGKYALKAVHMRRYGSQAVLLGTDRIEYDVGAEGVDYVGGVKESLQIFTSRNTLRDPVVVCLPGQDALSRFIKIVADDEKKLQELVNYEARQQIPFDIEDVVWDWELVPRDYVPGQEKEVGIFAARRETVDDLLIDLEAQGIKGQMIVLGYLGLLNYALYELRPRIPSVVLDIGADSTALILIDNGAYWIRALPFSGNQITRTLSSRFKLTFAEAERLKRQAARNPQAPKIFAAIQGVLGDFVNEIQRSVGFYRSQIAEATFKNVYLLGQASYTLGLGKFLKDRLGWRVQRVGGLARIRAGEGVDIASVRPQLASLAPALGAGLQGLGLSRTDVNLMPREQQVQLAFARRRKLVFVAGLLMLLVLFLVGNRYEKLTDRADKRLAEANRVLKKLNDHEKKMPSAYEVKKSRVKLEALMAIGKERLYFDRAFKAIDGIFRLVQKKALAEGAAGLKLPPTLGKGNDPRAESVFLVPVSEEDTATEEVKKFVENMHRSSAWILGIEVKLKGESPAGQKRRPGVLAESAKKEPPAYEFTLTGAIRSEDTLDASLKVVDSRVIKPLTALFQKTESIKKYLVSPPKALTVDNPESPVPATEGDRAFTRQYYLVDPRRLQVEEEDTKASEEAPLEEQGKFYIFKIGWVIGEGAPPEEATDTAVEG